MKFGKELQRTSQLTDPSWLPFFMNYKLCKKFLNQMPAESDESSQQEEEALSSSAATRQAASRRLADSPQEVAFFKLVHAELRKASWFFEKAQAELAIREEQMQASLQIVQRKTPGLLKQQKWSVMALAVQRLRQDLLLLETYAVYTYSAFSKILKKHDKVTGRLTRQAFLSTFVDKANFAECQRLLSMIQRSQELHLEIAVQVQREKEYRRRRRPLREDEMLFLSMVQQLNHAPPTSSIVMDAEYDQTTTNKQCSARRRSKRLMQQQHSELAQRSGWARATFDDSMARHTSLMCSGCAPS